MEFQRKGHFSPITLVNDKHNFRQKISNLAKQQISFSVDSVMQMIIIKWYL